MDVVLIKNKNVDLEDAFSDYKKHRIMRGLSASTIDADTYRFRVFANWCHENKIHDVNQLSEDVFTDYVVFLSQRNNLKNPQKQLSKNTIRKHVDFLKQFARFLRQKNLAPYDYAANLVKPKVPIRTIPSFTEEQISTIFKYLSKLNISSERHFKMKVLFHLLLDTGLRISEALSLKPTNFDHSRRLLTVIGKGDKQREVPYGDYLASLIEKLIQRQNISRDDYLWKSKNQPNTPITAASVRRILHQIKNLAGNESSLDAVNVSPHMFRHTFSRRWIMNGGDAFSLQRILGHTSSQTTEKYVFMFGDDLVSKYDSVFRKQP